MITLNLLPDIKKEYLKTQRNRRLIITFSAIASGGLAALVVVALVVTKGVQNNHLDNLKTDIDTAVNEIKATEDLNKILTVNSQLDTLPGLHDQKPLPSRMLQYLQVLTPSNVSINELNIDFSEDKTEFTLSGLADSLADINVFADTLKNATYTIDQESEAANAFTQVAVPSYGAVSDSRGSDIGIGFSVEAQYDPTIFSVLYPNLKLTVPNITSSRANQETPTLLFDTQGVPQDGGDQ